MGSEGKCTSFMLFNCVLHFDHCCS
jgi:hypothetical protein